MSKRNKKNNPNIPRLYTKRDFEKDISNGVSIYVSALGVVVRNTKLIELVKHKLDTNTTLDEESRQSFTQAILMMLNHTHQTLDTLDKVERDFIGQTPPHYPRNDSNVTDWVMNIQANLISACEWITELTPVYQSIIEGLQLSDNMAIENPAPKKEEE